MFLKVATILNECPTEITIERVHCYCFWSLKDRRYEAAVSLLMFFQQVPFQTADVVVYFMAHLFQNYKNHEESK